MERAPSCSLGPPSSASSRLPSRVSDPSKQPESRGMSPLGPEGDGRASEVSPSSASLAAGRGAVVLVVLLGCPVRGSATPPQDSGGLPPLPRTLTVVVQEELGGRQQLGAVLGVHDVQFVQVGLPQLFEVLQGLVPVQQEGGGVFLRGGRGQG